MKILILSCFLFCNLLFQKYEDQYDPYKTITGTWYFQSDGKNFSIILKNKTIYISKANKYINVVEGTYMYKEGTNILSKGEIDGGSNSSSSDKHVFSFFLHDSINKKYYTCDIILNSLNPDIAEFKLNVQNGLSIKNNLIKSSIKAYLPNNIMLKKILD